jgi:uncharacterized membrane protein
MNGPDRRRGDDRELYRLDRLLTLLDGVFAISMTLLVLDVRIPDDVPDTAAGFNGALGHLLGRLGVFVAAFLITSRFWMLSHRQLAGLTAVDRGVGERTILFLAGITTLPVATGVLFRYSDVPGAVTFAAVVLALTGALAGRLWWYASSPKRDLMEVEARDRHVMMLRMVLVVVTYLLAIPLAYLLPADHAGLAPLPWLLLIVLDPLTTRLHRLLNRAGWSTSTAGRRVTGRDE